LSTPKSLMIRLLITGACSSQVVSNHCCADEERRCCHRVAGCSAGALAPGLGLLYLYF
jgi:hypothetical protein